jgi:NADPH:quinone reductase-like Zn-dependent oxidoreductase
MSRTIKFAKAGGPEVLEFIETPVLTPGPREVRIKVKAIGINRAESMWRNDKYTEAVKFSAGLGYEAAGVVDAMGKDVVDSTVGDAVGTIPVFSMNKYFTYGEVILVPDFAVVKHPESLSFVEAASVWMMFIAAYGALIFDAQVKAGDFVIIPAASSSVGLAAIQIAKYAGATPIALTRTSDKKKRLHEAGAAHVIATQEQDMVAEVMRRLFCLPVCGRGWVSCDCRGHRRCGQPIKPRTSSLQCYDCSPVGLAGLGRHRRVADQQWPVARPPSPRP